MTEAIEPPSVVVEGLHVRYRVLADSRRSMREILARGLQTRTSIEVHALKGVDLEFHKGEIVGIVGPNGSGKSTLLRCIAGLQARAAGRVLVRGESRLLGVQAALKPRLSGNHNVILGGLAMGLPRAEVEARVDEVVEFSGIGDAIWRPMETYSSGMRARVAFSIATLRSPEVLLLDEALAVGDKEFRDRSLDRIASMRDHAHTVVMVSHNSIEIEKTCSRAIWLQDGIIRMDGAVDEVLSAYESAPPA